MQVKKIYDAQGDDSLEARQLIGGSTSNLVNLNNIKYKWASSLITTMNDNFWIPQKTSMVQDVQDYKKLSADEKKAYDTILSFLVFLDSIQVNNLPNLARYVTAPEVSTAISVQTFQETIHSLSYSYIIESVVPAGKRQAIYDLVKKDKVLLKRVEYITNMYQSFADHDSERNFYIAVLANFLLETCYFYNSFQFFYTLNSRHLMPGTAAQIKYINVDENSHGAIFQNIIRELRPLIWAELGEDFIVGMLKEAALQEIEWSNHILGDKVLGISEESIEQYTKYLVNQAAIKIGMPIIYKEFTNNPYEHLKRIADLEGKGEVKSGFFEISVTSYSQSTGLEGFTDW